jgi:mannitol/fructose-specific phosphotransferase system IIA component (Ntr-type)
MSAKNVSKQARATDWGLNMNEGRLEYWKAKSKLCHDLFYEQVKDPEKQDEAVENLARFIEANRHIERLTNGQNFDWIYSTTTEGNSA